MNAKKLHEFLDWLGFDRVSKGGKNMSVYERLTHDWCWTDCLHVSEKHARQDALEGRLGNTLNDELIY